MTDAEKQARAILETARRDRLRRLHAAADKGDLAGVKVSADVLAEMDRRLAELGPAPAGGDAAPALRRVFARG